MANIEIDESLNKHLGLPDSYQLDKKDAFNLYKTFMGYIETKHPVGTLLLCYYADFNKDFYQNPKTKQDELVKVIIDNLDKKEQFEMFSYISDGLAK